MELWGLVVAALHPAIAVVGQAVALAETFEHKDLAAMPVGLVAAVVDLGVALVVAAVVGLVA